MARKPVIYSGNEDLFNLLLEMTFSPVEWAHTSRTGAGSKIPPRQPFYQQGLREMIDEISYFGTKDEASRSSLATLNHLATHPGKAVANYDPKKGKSLQQSGRTGVQQLLRLAKDRRADHALRMKFGGKVNMLLGALGALGLLGGISGASS